MFVEYSHSVYSDWSVATFVSLCLSMNFQCVIGFLFHSAYFFLYFHGQPALETNETNEINESQEGHGKLKSKRKKWQRKSKMSFEVLFSFFLRLLLCVFASVFFCLPCYSRTNHESVRVFSTSM